MALIGAQPAVMHNNPDVDCVLFAKLNSIQGFGGGNQARADIHEHLRTALRHDNWITHGRFPVIATKQTNRGDDQLREGIERLLLREEAWALGNNDEHPRGLLANHPGFQWTILRPLRISQQDEDIAAVLAALFNENE